MLKPLSLIAPVGLSILLFGCGIRPGLDESPPPTVGSAPMQSPTRVVRLIRDVEVGVIYSGGPYKFHQRLTRNCGTVDAVSMGRVVLRGAKGRVVREARFHSSARPDGGRAERCEYFATLERVPVADGYRIFEVPIREEELARGHIQIEVPMK